MAARYIIDYSSGQRIEEEVARPRQSPRTWKISYFFEGAYGIGNEHDLRKGETNGGWCLPLKKPL